MHAKIKYMELNLIRSLMHVTKFTTFSHVLKMHTKENWFFFSASQCTKMQKRAQGVYKKLGNWTDYYYYNHLTASFPGQPG